MRFLADENFPGVAVGALAETGHDVVWVRATAPGASDTAVLAQAASEGRVLLTFDKDFGELASASLLPADCGVVLFRIVLQKPSEAGAGLAQLLNSRPDWAGHFSVVEPGRIRMRRLKNR